MSKPLRLSHSQASRFQDCPKSFQYHYQQNLRSTTKSAALFFGSAIDVALSAMLEKPETAIQVFKEAWTSQEHNGKKLHLVMSTEIVYANSDYDDELLVEEDLVSISNMLDKPEGFDILEETAKIYKQKEAIGFNLLSKDKKVLLNTVNWFCLYRKGLAMLNTLKEEIIPNITEVLATQKYVELENETGDKVIGYADLICKYKGYDEPIIFDLKTSSRPYEEDSVLTSPQLALYVYGLYDEYKTHKAGYIVLSKQIRKNKTKICSKCGNDGSGKAHKTCDALVDGKRCHGDWKVTLDPKAIVQVIVDDVPEKTQEIVIENMGYVSDSIKHGVFPRSFNSCIKPWGKCSFHGLCFRDDMTGLVKEDKE